MAEPKAKPARRVAGARKFMLPERPPRVAETNPARDILQEAKAQEEALRAATTAAPLPTPAKKSAGVSDSLPARGKSIKMVPDTPAKKSAGVSPAGRAGGRTRASGFDDFARRWSPILRAGQLSVCRALYELTHSAGETECFTSIPKLAHAAGLKERQCYNVIAQLEQLGFIERPEFFNTADKKGTIFRLHLSPQSPADISGRRYHIGSDDIE